MCYGPNGHRRPIDTRLVARPRRVFPSDRAPGRFRSISCRTEEVTVVLERGKGGSNEGFLPGDQLRIEGGLTAVRLIGQ
jgi:hypothetical protein